MRERDDYPILVPEAHAVGMLAVVRSLGRSGYPVVAISSQADAVGLRSRYAKRAFLHPQYHSTEFLPWLDACLVDNGIQAIVPSEGFLLSIRPAYEKYEPLLAVNVEKDAMFFALSKCDTISALSTSNEPRVRAHLPPTAILKGTMGSKCALKALGRELWVKTDACHSKSGADGVVRGPLDPEDAYVLADKLMPDYGKVLVQASVRGRGAGVYFLIREGEVIAEFMNVCDREVPHTGGLCSLRTSYRNDAIRDDALCKLRHLQWNGIAMMEYRLDGGEFWFIELNARFWAALMLALYCGIDFPTMLIDERRGERREPRLDYAENVRCRWTFPADAGHLLSILRDSRVPIARKLKSIGRLGLDCLNPTVKTDLGFPGDRMLYWYEMLKFFRQIAARR